LNPHEGEREFSPDPDQQHPFHQNAAEYNQGDRNGDRRSRLHPAGNQHGKWDHEKGQKYEYPHHLIARALKPAGDEGGLFGNVPVPDDQILGEKQTGPEE
jgi:hypothetical protein